MGSALTISVEPSSLRRIKENLRRRPELLKKQIAGALNDTAKHGRANVSSLIRDRVNIKKQDIDKYIDIQRAYPGKLEATVVLEKTDRLPLKYFGARQTKKGVTYRIEKMKAPPKMSRTQKNSSGPKERISDAFGPNIPRLGGHVYRRKEVNGKKSKRLPIVKLFGPSAWGVFVRNGLHKLVKKDSQAYLRNRLAHRIEYQVK